MLSYRDPWCSDKKNQMQLVLLYSSCKHLFSIYVVCHTVETLGAQIKRSTYNLYSCSNEDIKQEIRTISFMLIGIRYRWMLQLDDGPTDIGNLVSYSG